MREKWDVVIVGASFAGLACAKASAQKGLKVLVLERKTEPGEAIHTTGIIVKEASDDWKIPDQLIKKAQKINLYSPSLKLMNLTSDSYFFLTTDTPNLMRHFAKKAEEAGATISYSSSYKSSHQEGSTIFLDEYDIECDYLIGADGPRSKVAVDYKLGQNKEFLMGAEIEIENPVLPDRETFYCFLDNELAHGYIGWAIPGVDVIQIGLATRWPEKPNMDAFLEKIKPIIPTENLKIRSRRGGLIPVGGTVKPFYKDNVILIGDASGVVSPLTAGGIHTALHYGDMLGTALADHIELGAPHPGLVIEKKIPHFYFKHLLRKILENLTPNWLLDFCIGLYPFKMAANIVFFKKKQLR